MWDDQGLECTKSEEVTCLTCYLFSFRNPTVSLPMSVGLPSARLSQTLKVDRGQDNRHKLNWEIQTRFKENLFPLGTNSGSGGLKSLWNLQHGRFSRLGWIKKLKNLACCHGWPCFEWEVGLEAFWGWFQFEFPCDLIQKLINVHTPPSASHWHSEWKSSKAAHTCQVHVWV